MQKWVDDILAEQVCKKYGVTWSKRSIRLEDIDWDASKENPGRPESRLDNDRVTLYACQMLDGARFPCPAVRRGHKGFVIVSGVHRLHAAMENKIEEVEAYLLDIKDEHIADNMPLYLNEINGEPLTMEQRLIAAYREFEQHGVTKTEAAKNHGLDTKAFSKYCRVVEVDAWLSKNGFDTTKFSRTTLGDLATLDFSEELMKATATFLFKNRVKSIDDAKNIIRGVRDCRGDKAGKAFLCQQEENYKDVRAPSASQGRLLSKRERFVRQLRSFNTTIKPYDRLTQVQVSDAADKEALAVLAHEVWVKLGAWFGFEVHNGNGPVGTKTRRRTVAAGR